ncbi:hypothetical protein PLANPX_5203 [Lacipirellula parvula]|uniref:Uncharacterized protein n=1 Tax=Lacipirellula parvula TaxID=2650471 RepID=A0A5K7XKC0_9BACT|nr:hypothetical protein PLANPX_5203 [Lacipirellula parvula]
MSIATQMAAVIDRWRSTAVNVPSHQSHQLSSHPVAWWFNTQNATTVELMRALASDTAYVTPGNPETSRIIKVFLRNDRPMGRTLAGDLPVIRQWIAEGAPTELGEVAPVAPSPPQKSPCHFPRRRRKNKPSTSW